MIMYLILGVIIAAAIAVTFISINKLKNNSQKKSFEDIDYYTLFIMGIIWLACGIPLKNYGLSGLGFVFMIVGLKNKDKWKQNHKSWKELSKERKSFKIVMLLLIGLLFLGLIVGYLFAKNMS